MKWGLCLFCVVSFALTLLNAFLYMLTGQWVSLAAAVFCGACTYLNTRTTWRMFQLDRK